MFRSIQAIVLIAVGCFVIYEFHSLGKTSLALSKAQSAQAEGTVVEILREGWSRNHGQVVTRTVKVAFTASSGRQVCLTAELFEEEARAADVGKKLPVRYDPADPSNNDIGKVGQLFYYVVAVYVVAGGFVLAGLIMLWRMRPAIREWGQRT